MDHHSGIISARPSVCRRTVPPAAALITDLRQRGLPDSTVFHRGGEMGRLPIVQNERSIGRDHNTCGFSMRVAGGGFKGGVVHGATDEPGHKAVENVVNQFDDHATLLHLFGLSPDQTSFRRANGTGRLLEGRPRRQMGELPA